MRPAHVRPVVALLVALAGCDPGEMPTDPGDPPVLGDAPGFDVAGQVVDFETGAALAGSATAATYGLDPAPSVTVSGAAFTVKAVPAHSVFFLLAGSPPAYRNGFSNVIRVADQGLSGVTAAVVKESYLAQLATAFGVTPQNGTGVLFARAVDAAGLPAAGVPGDALTLAGAAGPFLLDATMQPAPAAAQTSTSGWMVFFDVPAGLAEVKAKPGANLTVQSPTAPTAINTVTLVDVQVTAGAPALPTGVSLSRDVMPLFTARGCVNCHSGNGPGKDLGGLMFNADANKVHRELTQEPSPSQGVLRVNLPEPEKSLVLTMPSLETPADKHPTATFASPADPDYQKLLVWIREGAKNN